MNQNMLIDDLTEQLRTIFTGYELLNKAGVLQQIKVFKQYVPQPEGITFAEKDKTGLQNYTSSDYESNFPCVIVKLIDETDNEERSLIRSTVNVTLLTAVYDEAVECQGYVDVLNIQEKMRLFLLEHRILCERYILNMPLKSRLIDVETWPVYWGEMNLIYTLARPAKGQIYG